MISSPKGDVVASSVAMAGHPPLDIRVLLRLSCDLQRCESRVGWGRVGYRVRLVSDLEQKDMAFALAGYSIRRGNPCGISQWARNESIGLREAACIKIAVSRVTDPDFGNRTGRTA